MGTGNFKPLTTVGQAGVMPVPAQWPARVDSNGFKYTISILQATILHGELFSLYAVDQEHEVVQVSKQCSGQACILCYVMRLKIRVPLVPPKPNELESAISIFIWRAVCGT